MSKQNATKSLNGLVFEIAYKRLKLKRREKIILQRLLGFLVRNDKPFPFSRKKLSELTGYSKSSIHESLNKLETLRLIDRIGLTNRTRFTKGKLLRRICTLAQKRINNIQNKSCTLVQKLDKSFRTSPVSGYKKTYLSSKHKEEPCSVSLKTQLKYNNYVQDKKALMRLKLLPIDSEILEIEEWSLSESYNVVE